MTHLWRYEAKPERQYHQDLGWYTTYLLSAERKVHNGWEQAEIIHDVTPNRALAQKIAGLCTQYQLSPIHMRDVIEDMVL